MGKGGNCQVSLNDSDALRGNKSNHIGEMIYRMKKFSETRDEMFAKHPEKANKKQDWLVFLNKYI
jgi:hypothetical protein